MWTVWTGPSPLLQITSCIWMTGSSQLLTETYPFLFIFKIEIFLPSPVQPRDCFNSKCNVYTSFLIWKPRLERLQACWNCTPGVWTQVSMTLKLDVWHCWHFSWGLSCEGCPVCVWMFDSILGLCPSGVTPSPHEFRHSQKPLSLLGSCPCWEPLFNALLTCSVCWRASLLGAH